MNIVIFNENRSEYFQELREKAYRNNWHIVSVKIPNDYYIINWDKFYRLIDKADYIVFGYMGSTAKRVADKCCVFFNRKNFRNRILHFTDQNKYFIKGIYTCNYTKEASPWDDIHELDENMEYNIRGLYIEEEECYPIYENSVSDEQKEHYKLYIQLYDLEYPHDNHSWLSAIEQIEYYIANDLSYCISEEDAERIINNYSQKAELTKREKSRLRYYGLSELI